MHLAYSATSCVSAGDETTVATLEAERRQFFTQLSQLKADLRKKLKQTTATELRGPLPCSFTPGGAPPACSSPRARSQLHPDGGRPRQSGPQWSDHGPMVTNRKSNPPSPRRTAVQADVSSERSGSSILSSSGPGRPSRRGAPEVADGELTAFKRRTARSRPQQMLTPQEEREINTPSFSLQGSRQSTEAYFRHGPPRHREVTERKTSVSVPSQDKGGSPFRQLGSRMRQFEPRSSLSLSPSTTPDSSVLRVSPRRLSLFVGERSAASPTDGNEELARRDSDKGNGGFAAPLPNSGSASLQSRGQLDAGRRRSVAESSAYSSCASSLSSSRASSPKHTQKDRVGEEA